MQLQEYHANGRTFVDEVNPLRRQWEGLLKERNLFDGQWRPYVWEGAALRNAFGRMSFSPDEQSLEGQAGLIGARNRLVLESLQGGNWNVVAKGVPIRDRIDDDERGFSAGRLTFPFTAIPLAQRPELQIFFQAGRREQGTLWLRYRSPQERTFRLRWIFERVAGLPTPVMAGPGPRGQVIQLGLDCRDVGFRWKWFEAAYHNVEIFPNGTDWDVHIVIGPFDSNDQWQILRPTTWGPTNTGASDDDDGNFGRDNAWATNGWDGFNTIYLSGAGWTGSGPDWLGFRWLPNIGADITSIDAGTQISVVNAGDNSSATSITATLRGDNAANAAVFSTAASPESRTGTTASVSLTGSTGNQTWDVEGIVAELAEDGQDNNTYTGTQGMAFVAQTTTTGMPYWSVCDDSGTGQTPATLTIVYTATAAATLRQYRLTMMGVS